MSSLDFSYIYFTLQEKDLQQLLPGVKIPASSTESSSGDIKLSGRPTQSSFALLPWNGGLISIDIQTNFFRIFKCSFNSVNVGNFNQQMQRHQAEEIRTKSNMWALRGIQIVCFFWRKLEKQREASRFEKTPSYQYMALSVSADGSWRFGGGGGGWFVRLGV